ncbi:3-oxoadipate enol-lactonase [Tistlia consotensis]|uniref:3-oxoadipate enol-lactonase n=1 Tax=Tistlia consotensis USBA 355 TaxID=560819 RepID=A0A1Y6BYT7_9PROT|nr:alpha/beta fold hydrolase [Tistlia consotensis]SMF36431.1 3-oxoadipate enol-lactonase [Tistlia consotensis USBA 355]SNR71894.1 3-oxoadipate enol-lactonase [Tistlia consotensis]
MTIFDDGIRRLNYVDEGEGPPLVLIHGVGANLQSWDEVARRLVGRFRVIRADLRGHGASARIEGRFSLEAFAEDSVALLDHLGIDRAHVAGFSLGGLIAQCLAVGWPARIDRLALISAVANRTEEERAKVVGRLEMIEKDGIQAVTGAARERWFTEAFAAAHPDRIARRIAELVANDKASYLEAYRVFGQSEMGPRLHEIGHRTLVLTGEFDVGSNPRMARFMHEQIRRSELVILPGLKHSLLAEVPELIAERLEAFLAG